MTTFRNFRVPVTSPEDLVFTAVNPGQPSRSLLWSLTGAFAAVISLSTSPAHGMSDRERLKRLERHLEQLEQKNEELEGRLQKTEEDNRLLRQSAKPSIGPPSSGAGQASSAGQDKPVSTTRITSIDESRLKTDHPDVAAPSSLPRNIELGSQGLRVVSSDQDFIMYIRAQIQADGEFFLDGNSSPHDPSALSAGNYNLNNQFYMRRVRPTIEGTIWKFIDYRLMPDFAPGPSGDAIGTRLFDAYADIHYFRAASFAGGMMKAPVSLERLESSSNLTFVERAFTTQLAPNREVGFMLHGEFDHPDHATKFDPMKRNMTSSSNFPMYNYPDFFAYQVGVFNGSVNAGSLYSDTNDSKDVQARIFTHPFMHTGWSLLEGLGMGVGGTMGYENFKLEKASYQSPGLQKIFSYNAQANGAGDTYRVYPQAYWIAGPFKLLGEYAVSSLPIATTLKGTTYKTTQNMSSWNLTADYVLTGEHNTFLGQGIRPHKNFNPFDGGWGAWQVAARWTPISFGNNVFANYGTAAAPIYPFADPRNAVSSAATWALGANWWLNPNLKIMFDYSQTSFSGGAAPSQDLQIQGSVNRATERVFQTRLQLGF